jgi:hypothetical protein
MAESFQLSKGQTQNASLGCGSLIVVGIVVLFVAQSIVQPLRQEVANLRTEVAELKKDAETQANQIRVLNASMNKPEASTPK